MNAPAATGPGLRPDALGLHSMLADILDAVPGRGATLYTPQLPPGSPGGIWCSLGIPAEALRDYAAHYADADIWAIAASRVTAPPAGAVMDTDRLVAPEQLRATAFHNDYLRRYEIGRCLVAIVDDGRGPALPRVRMTVVRAESESPFSAVEVQRLSQLTRIARTCVSLAGAGEEAAQDALLHRAAFDLVRMPVMLVDREHRILQANQSAATMLRSGAALLSRNGRLQAREAGAERDLQRALGGGPGAQRPVRFVRLGPGRRAPVVVISRLIEAPDEVLVVRVIEPGVSCMEGAAVLRELLDLTPAECAVALGVSEGLSHDEIARRRGVKVTSVRTTLRRVQEKLGIQRTGPLAHFIQSLIGLGGLRL